MNIISNVSAHFIRKIENIIQRRNFLGVASIWSTTLDNNAGPNPPYPFTPYHIHFNFDKDQKNINALTILIINDYYGARLLFFIYIYIAAFKQDTG